MRGCKINTFTVVYRHIWGTPILHLNLVAPPDSSSIPRGSPRKLVVWRPRPRAVDYCFPCAYFYCSRMASFRALRGCRPGLPIQVGCGLHLLLHWLQSYARVLPLLVLTVFHFSHVEEKVEEDKKPPSKVTDSNSILKGNESYWQSQLNSVMNTSECDNLFK